MTKSEKAQKKLTKAQLAVAFEVSLPTIDSWLRKGCPYENKGGHGRPWRFSLPKVIQWRESMAAISAQEWKGGHLHGSGQNKPELMRQRPDYENPLRFFAEEGAKHFLWWWCESNPARAVSGYLRQEKGLSRLETFETMQFIACMLFNGVSEWVGADAFNEDVFGADGSDIDIAWRTISNQSVSTSPPPNPKEAVTFQAPEWLMMKADEYVATHWPDDAST